MSENWGLKEKNPFKKITNAAGTFDLNLKKEKIKP